MNFISLDFLTQEVVAVVATACIAAGFYYLFGKR